MDIEVSMMGLSGKNNEVCQVQFTVDGLPKLIMSKPIVAYKGYYSALSHNYGYSFQSTQPSPIFQVEVGGLLAVEDVSPQKSLRNKRRPRLRKWSIW
jgi:hypothetical protein